MYPVSGGAVGIVVVLCLVCKCGVDTSVDDVLGGVENIVVVFGFFVVVWGVVVGWHGTVIFLQHLNLIS